MTLVLISDKFKDFIKKKNSDRKRTTTRLEVGNTHGH